MKIFPEFFCFGKIGCEMGKAVVKYMLALFAFGAKQGRTSWGDSGALYLQPATAGMNPGPRTCDVSSDLDKQ